MTGPIMYEFAALEEGQANLMGCAKNLSQLNDDWTQQVASLLTTWIDPAGQVSLQNVANAFRVAVEENNEFQTRLAAAVAEANIQAQQTLNSCQTMIEA